MPPASKYTYGRSKEYEVVRFLRESGFSTIRAAGSKGEFDVIGYNRELVRFIQVKSSRQRYVSLKADIERIRSALLPDEGVTRELWVFEPRKLTVHQVSGPKTVMPKRASVVYSVES